MSTKQCGFRNLKPLQIICGISEDEANEWFTPGNSTASFRLSRFMESVPPPCSERGALVKCLYKDAMTRAIFKAVEAASSPRLCSRSRHRARACSSFSNSNTS